MKRKLISALLCVAILITAPPTSGSGAFAETKPIAETEPILAYVPLDNRPVNVDRVIYEAESAGFKVVMPAADLYTTRLDGQPLNKNGKQFGDSKKLLEWILEMDAVTDYFVISLDQLLSGGLVNSREITRTNYSDEFKMIDAVAALSKNNHVYIIDTVVRLAPCTVGYHEATLETYNYLRQYSSAPRYELSDNGLKIDRIVANYRRDPNLKEVPVNQNYSKEVSESLRVRERKLNLTDYILQKDAAGTMKYFIGIDDSSAENTIQTNEINYIKKKLADKGLIYSGTDELGMMAVLSLMVDYYGCDVSAAVVYFGDTEKLSSGSVYDMETVRENVEKHMESIGVRVTDPKEANFEIVVLTSPAKNILSAKYVNRTLDYINENIAKGIPTVLINTNPGAYNGNLEYRMIRECEMSMLLAYSGWNTAGNSIGLALCNGVSRYLYLSSREDSTDAADVAFLKGLAFSYEKDISYQRGGGKTLFNDYLTEKGLSASNFYQSDEQVKMVNADLEQLFKSADYNVTVNDIVENLTGCRYFKGLGGECGIIGKIGLSNYSAPFFRTFEIRFDIDVALSDLTINGFNNNISVNMPYTPPDAQLTYSLTLYYMDETGKVHMVPSTYDKNTGTINFTMDKLPRFFTSTFSLETEKAYSLFSDVSSSAWYFDDVVYAYEKGFMRGTGNGLFEPNAAMSRAMLVCAVYHMAGSPQVSADVDLPSDIGNKWYKDAAVWALESGIARADKNGNFNPESPVTREQLADILYRTAIYKGNIRNDAFFFGIHGYADVFAISGDFREGFDWVCKEGIMTGKGGSRLYPKDTATRAETAAVLKRFSLLEQ